MANTRIKLLAGVAAFSLTLAACNSDSDTNGSDTSAETTSVAADNAADVVEIEDNYGVQEIPANPQRVAVTDNRAFEILEAWDIPVVAAPKRLIPSTVDSMKNDDDIVDLGSHREPDLEALVAAQPDLIINGQRFTQHYDEIKRLNPDVAIVDFTPRDDEDFAEDMIRQTRALGEIFGKQDEAQALIDNFETAIQRAKDAYNSDWTVMAVNVSGGEIGYVAPSIGRTWGPIFDILGLTPALQVEQASDDHKGDDISVEAIAESNPDWMLVLDRDAAVSAREEADYVAAKDVIENSEALQNVTAIQENHVIYAPEDTYTNENIITYTEMLDEMADAFEAAQN